MYLIFIIIGTVVLDRIFKFIVSSEMVLGETAAVINNFFHITYIHNDGAAFGMMAGNQVFLVWIPAVMMVCCAVVLVVMRNKIDRIMSISIALVIGGGIGNLIDRLMYGYVIDFIDFKVWNPIFNIADVAVCTGCGLLVLYFIVTDRRKNEKPTKNNN